jgi:hypothetical protein
MCFMLRSDWSDAAAQLSGLERGTLCDTSTLMVWIRDFNISVK